MKRGPIETNPPKLTDEKSKNALEKTDTTEYEFLGTLAGEQKTFLKKFQNNNCLIYAREYESFLGTDDLRNKIVQKGDEKGGDGYKTIGEEYKREGGYFLTLKNLDEYDAGMNCFAYALKTFGEKLEVLAGESMDAIKGSVHESINHVVEKHFYPIEGKPKDGDLAIYKAMETIKLSQGRMPIYANSTTHAGIYRDSKPNWNSPLGGTIESKWGGFGNPYVFEHDVFFAPYFYGNRVEFYRLKEVACENSLSLGSVNLNV